MSTRRTSAIVILLLVLSSGTLSYFFLFNRNQTTTSTSEETYTPDPLNNLNWWDIAEQFADYPDIIGPLGRIAGFGNRYNPHEQTGYYKAANYLINLLQGWGIDADYVGTHYAILGHQKGYGTDNRAIVFGAHLDTDESGIGVQNNAGGCAVVAAIAKILSHFRLPIDVYYGFYSYNMVFLDSQKQMHALYGSKDVVKYLKDHKVKVIASYNFDELLFVDPLQDQHRRVLAEYNNIYTYGYHKTRYLADLLVAALKRTGLDVMTPVQNKLTQSDQQSFWAQNYPAINVRGGHTIDTENPPPDTVSSTRYDKNQALMLAKAAASVAVYLGMKGNGKETSFKMKRTLDAHEQVSIYTAISYPQKLTLTGTKSVNGTLRISFNNDTTLLYGPVDISATNYSIQTDQVPLGPLTVQIRNLDDQPIDVELYLHYKSDTDGDNVLDSVQYSWPPPNPPLDWDGDLLPDANESQYGTDIFVSDTDGDSVPDGVEVMYGMDPLRDDTHDDNDHDGLSNIREIQLHLNPATNDTDSDGMDDFWEVTFDTNPLVNDSQLDYDNDTLTNLEEYRYGADPQSSDGDFDGVPDSEEVARGMNPLSADTDKDGLNDRLELLDGLDPLRPDYDIDFVMDGFDHNPKINTILIVILISFLPIVIGTIVFRRRLYKSN